MLALLAALLEKPATVLQKYSAGRRSEAEEHNPRHNRVGLRTLQRDNMGQNCGILPLSANCFYAALELSNLRNFVY
jgi:hypothetical protein